MLRHSFNEGWSFTKDTHNGRGMATTPVSVTLPHDAIIKETRDESNPTQHAGGFFPGCNYTYTKTFFLEAEASNRFYYVEFEGVMNRARVYVNGAFAFSNQYGYTGFTIDISPHLLFGQDNTIQVKVINGDVPNSRWYTGTGLYRPVMLLVGNEARVAPDGLRITTPQIDEDVSIVNTSIQLDYDGKETKRVVVHTQLLDESGIVVAAECTPVTLMRDSAPMVHQRISVKNVKLWNVDAPNLYTCRVVIKHEEKIVDETISIFGFREIRLDSKNGFRINGEHTLLRGACVHHDNGVLGAATFSRAEERRVELLKQAGFNSLRISHNSSSKAMLEACDKHGMLVMEESFDIWNVSKTPYDHAQNFSDCWENDVEAIVAKDYNHPSVIMYCIGNEITEVGNGAGAAWNRNIANKFRDLDPSRFVINSINSLVTIMNNPFPTLVEGGYFTQEQVQAIMSSEAQTNGPDINDVMTMLLGKMNEIAAFPSIQESIEETCAGLDICGFNYMRGAYEKQIKEHPNRIICGSETLPPDIDLNWALCKKHPQIIGDYTWTGWDYLGEAGIGIEAYDGVGGFNSPYPAYIAYCGDIDITGHRRPMSYYREIVFGLRKAPYIAVEYPEHYSDKKVGTPWIVNDSVSSWTWKGSEGNPCIVNVYSDAEEVELLINGKSQGKLPAGEANRFVARFDVTYEPGKIEAFCYRNNGTTEHFELTTAADMLTLNIEPDLKELRAGEQDLSHIMISLVDNAGVLHTTADRKVTVAVEGPGILQGFGSADYKSTENFFDTERTTFNGKVLAVVRAGKEAGKIKVTVQCEGCEDVIVDLAVK